MVAFSMEMCTGQTVPPDQVPVVARARATAICSSCKTHPIPDCLKDFINAQQLIIDHNTAGDEKVAREVKKLLEDCCTEATGQMDKCGSGNGKKGNGGHFLAPKAGLVLLLLGTLMLAWLYWTQLTQTLAISKLLAAI